MRKKIILGAVVVSLIGVGVFWAMKKPSIRDQNGQPQQSAEEILQERARQATSHLKTPLGTAFSAKNWADFDKLYQPQKDFLELAQIIRACFIENCFKDYSKADHEKVFTEVVKTFSGMKQQDFALAGLLITQFERLPTPSHDSENYRALEGWYLDPEASPAKKRMAVLKLGVQDAEPAMQWSHVLIQGITGKTFGLSHSSWIQMIGDMRNEKSKKTVLASVLKDFSKIEKEAQPDALIVLAQSQETGATASSKVKALFFKFLSSRDQKEFEAALKSVMPLQEAHAFSADEVTKIKDRLHSIPDDLRTPYADLKIKELLNTVK